MTDAIHLEIDEQNEILPISDKNKLNSLTGREWIQLTKSFWFQKGLGKDHSDTKIEMEHPAPFSYQDIEKLINLFTKPKMVVLDPFCGIASTLKAAALTDRDSIGIEISPKWVKLGKARLESELPNEIKERNHTKIIRGDCLKRLLKIEDESIDFIVTSPPYWKILSKAGDHKVRSERIEKGLATKYSKSSSDFGNISDYSEYLAKLKEVGDHCFRVLKDDKYFAIIVSDFYHKSQYYAFHVDCTKEISNSGFTHRGTTILLQNQKKLFPYGYPYSYIQNIHHQYILIFQKL